MRIFIDPGHNYSKFDTGASGNGLREQDITFQVAEKLSKLLKGVGLDISMSRNKITDNVGINLSTSLSQRAALANNAKADLFVSLHTDSSTSSSARGSHICIYKKETDGAKLADKINPHLLSLGLEGRSDIVVERPDLAVLKKTNMPAILIEMGFISNTRDANMLKNNQDGLANAIFMGICDFLKISYAKKENNVTSTSNETTIKIDGKVADIDFTTINDSVYVPIRAFCNLLGYKVDWNDSTKEVIVTTNDKTDVQHTQPVISPTDISPTKYVVNGTTHIVEIDPRNIFHVESQVETNKTPYNNFVNSLFFMPQGNGVMFPQGIAVNAGEVISNYATHGRPVATLICYGWNNVQLKYISDITKEKNVWFAVSGYGIYPKITASEEGFVNEFADVMRSANRPIIGYRKSDNKIVIAVDTNIDAITAQKISKNLGLDFAISLDAGGSTTLKINGDYKFKGDGRKLWGGIIWN